MSKSIQVTRDELVWQTRCVSWDETDYLNLLDWLKSFENKEGNWAKNHYNEYLFLKDYSWDQIAELFNNPSDEEPTIPYIGDNGKIWYTTSITDLIQEYIREDVYCADVTDENYADDYTENWEVIDNPNEQ